MEDRSASRNQPGAKVHYAGFWIRVAALVIDAVVIGLPVVAIVEGTGATGTPTGETFRFFATAAYLIVLWATWGRTVGERLVGVHVVRDDGGRVSWGTAAVRYLGLLVSLVALLLGVIWIAFNPRKQGWMDIMAGTFVVYDRPRE
jgi:uncharacterized RDD family membrane protein YckC